MCGARGRCRGAGGLLCYCLLLLRASCLGKTLGTTRPPRMVRKVGHPHAGEGESWQAVSLGKGLPSFSRAQNPSATQEGAVTREDVVLCSLCVFLPFLLPLSLKYFPHTPFFPRRKSKLPLAFWKTQLKSLSSSQGLPGGGGPGPPGVRGGRPEALSLSPGLLQAQSGGSLPTQTKEEDKVTKLRALLSR